MDRYLQNENYIPQQHGQVIDQCITAKVGQNVFKDMLFNLSEVTHDFWILKMENWKMKNEILLSVCMGLMFVACGGGDYKQESIESLSHNCIKSALLSELDNAMKGSQKRTDKGEITLYCLCAAEIAIGDNFSDDELKAIYKGLDNGMTFGKLQKLKHEEANNKARKYITFEYVESNQQALHQCLVETISKAIK